MPSISFPRTSNFRISKSILISHFTGTSPQAILGASITLSLTLLLSIFSSHHFSNLHRAPLIPHSGHHEPSTFYRYHHTTHHLSVLLALQHFYDLPPSFTSRLPANPRLHLLRVLQTRPQTSHSTLVFFLHLVGSSLVDRLRSIASAIAYSRNTERTLVILWDTAHANVSVSRTSVFQRESVKDPSIIFAFVHDFVPNHTLSSWSDHHMHYLYPSSQTQFNHTGFILDDVVSLAERHVYCKTGFRLQSHYAPISNGVFEVGKLLAPGESSLQAWRSFVHVRTIPELSSEKVIHHLLRDYLVPKVFINALDDQDRRRLLSALFKSNTKRAIFAHVQYGLGNRLRVLGSAMALAQASGRVLVVIWEKDIHLNCEFSDLFSNDMVLIKNINLPWPPRHHYPDDFSMRYTDFYNFMRSQNEMAYNPSKVINPRNGRHLYFKSAYVVLSSFTPGIASRMRVDHWQVLRHNLVPRVEVMKIVNDPAFDDIRQMTGVHIRSRSIKEDIDGVDEGHYGSSSSARTDFWRQLTQVDTFIKYMKNLNDDIIFFVAADKKSAIQVLRNEFGEDRIISIPREKNCVRRDTECAILALADMYLLSRVSTLLGSNWSSFSEIASRLSGSPNVLLAGVDFGLKKRKEMEGTFGKQ